MFILYHFLLSIEVLVSLFLLLLILMQRPKSEGLGTAFGGGMTGDLFGAQTTNVLQKATRWLAGTFFLVALILSYMTSHSARNMANQSVIEQKLSNAPVPKDLTSEDLQKMLMKQESPTPANSGTGPAASPAPATSGTTLPPANLHAPAVQTGTAPEGLHLSPDGRLVPSGGSPSPAGSPKPH